MSAPRLVERARRALLAGHEKAAARAAWRAANAGVRQRDSSVIEASLEVARTLSLRGDPQVRKGAEQLAAYCQAVLDGAGGGINAPTELERLFRRSSSEPSRMPCPTCGEDIAARARICRFCGGTLGQS